MRELQSSSPAAQAQDEEKRTKKNHARRNRQKRKKNRRIFRLMWWAMVLLIGLLIGRYLVWIMNDVLAVNRPDIQVTIEIPSSVTALETSPSDLLAITDAAQRREAEENNRTATREVAQILKNNGIIDNVEFFCLYSNIRGADGRYHNGTWTLSQKSDFEELVHLFRSDDARQDVVQVTIPEGRNALEIAQLLYDEGVISSEDAFLQELNTSDFNSTYTMVSEISDLEGRY